MKAIREIGFGGAANYVFSSLLYGLFKLVPHSPLRVVFLKLVGVKIGENAVIEDVKFINLYRKGWRGLNVGRNCYLGSECILDLAESITLEDDVTLSCGSIILTHTNVGYSTHPLKKFIKSSTNSVVVGEGCFVGSGAIIVGVSKVAPKTALAAGAVMTKNNHGNELLAGVPAKRLRSFS